MVINRREILPVICIAAMAMQGCSHRPIEDCDAAKAHFTVIFDWEYAPQAAPEGMALLFRSEETGEMWRFDIAGREGGSLELPSGRYRVASFNNDMPDVRLTGWTSTSTAALACKETSPGVLKPSGMLWSASLGEVTVNPCGVVTLKPAQRTVAYDVVVKTAGGGESYRTINASLSGTAPSFLLFPEEADGIPATMAFPLSRQGDCFRGAATGFGTGGWADGKFTLSLTVAGKTRSWQREFDVADQVLESTDPLDVHIVIDGVELPPDESGGDVGLEVDVGGWTVVDINLTT